ncbi:MAG TPA: glycosyltransferase [Bacteroidales bacterium]|nr:glycosyltransferase [Bacteroidales bacterium]
MSKESSDFNKRKVVIIGSAHPLRGGLATYNERLAKEYIDQGNDVTIYTFSLQYPGFLFPGKTQYSTEPAPKGIPIKIKINSINPMNWIKVGRHIKNERPDLVIIKFWIPFMAPCLGTISRIIRKNKHTKIISILDNLIPHERRPGDLLLIRYWVNSVDGFIAMSRSVLGEINQILTSKPKPTLFCPHPLYDNFGGVVPKAEAKKHLGLDPGYSYILFFGFIRDYKGLDLLLKAFADERLRAYPLKLLVAGEFYTDAKPYFDLIEQLHLAELVIMNNEFIPDSAVADYFCATDLVVQPYKSATQSGVTQIAYHFNKPMIITNVGGLGEFVPDGKVGYVVEPSVPEIASSILRFYDEKKEDEFSANAAVEKLKYSWGRMTESIDELANQ